MIASKMYDYRGLKNWCSTQVSVALSRASDLHHQLYTLPDCHRSMPQDSWYSFYI